MRNKLAEKLTIFAENNSNIILISADLGFSVFDNFKKHYPDQYLNIGIAENTAISMAAGMGMGGLKPYVYSIASFITAKCLEQIKEDVCIHESPVVFIGTGAGFAYGTAGYTHFALDDIAILRNIPGLTIISPSDPHELSLLMEEVKDYGKPVYIRLGKSGEQIYSEKSTLSIGESYFLREGEDVVLVVHGNIMSEVIDAANQLEKLGISTAIVSSPTIIPFDRSFFDELTSKYKHIFVVEEHYENGGLGDVLQAIGVEKIAVSIQSIEMGGSLKYLRRQAGIDSKAIVSRVKNTLQC